MLRNRNRTTKPKAPCDGEPQELEILAEVLLQSVAGSILESGVLPRERLAAQMRKVVADLEAGQSVGPLHSDDLSVYRSICDVVHDWCHDPGCASPVTGEPRSLRWESGDPSLSELIERHLPRSEGARARAWMERSEVIMSQDDGSYALKRPGRFVMIDSPSISAIYRVANLVTQQLSTTLENFRNPRSGAKNLERDAEVSNLPVRLLPEFRAFAKLQGQNFLEIINQWLTNRCVPDSTERAIRAGVHVYSYTGPSNSAIRRRKH
jgi:hypothetical protein